MDLSGVVSLVVLVVGVILLIPLLLGGVFVVVVVASRSEPDPSGRRARGVYAYATAFITLFAVIFATTALVASLAQLIGSHHDSGNRPLLGIVSSAASRTGQSLHPIGDASARGAVLSIIIAVIAGSMYRRHRTIGDDLAAGTTAVEPVGRVRQSYVAAVAFVCVALTVVASIVVVYDIFRLIAPGVFAPGLRDGRAAVFRSLLPALWLALLAASVRRRHLDVRPLPWADAPIA